MAKRGNNIIVSNMIDHIRLEVLLLFKFFKTIISISMEDDISMNYIYNIVPSLFSQSRMEENIQLSIHVYQGSKTSALI